MLIDILLTATIQILWNLMVKSDIHYAFAAESVYLDFDNLPDTNFSCNGKVIGGYYADVETGCQMFHVCTLGQKAEISDIKFLCLNGTVFDQQTRVCEREDEVDCNRSESFYNINLDLYGNRGNNANTLYGIRTPVEVNGNATLGSENNSAEKELARNATVSQFDVDNTITFSNVNAPSTTLKSNENGEFVTRSSLHNNRTNFATTNHITADGLPTIETPFWSPVVNPSAIDNSADIASQLLMLHEAFQQNLLNYTISENHVSRFNNNLNMSRGNYASQKYDTKQSRHSLPSRSSPIDAVSAPIDSSHLQWRANDSYQFISSDVKPAPALLVENANHSNKTDSPERFIDAFDYARSTNKNVLEYTEGDSHDGHIRSFSEASPHLTNTYNSQLRKELPPQYRRGNDDVNNLQKEIATNSHNKQVTNNSPKSAFFTTYSSTVLPFFNVVKPTDSAILYSDFTRVSNTEVNSQSGNRNNNSDSVIVSQNGTKIANILNATQYQQAYDEQEEDYYYY